MTQKDEALRMAIEFIEQMAVFTPTDYDQIGIDVVNACKAALSEAETYQVSEIQSFTVDGICITAEQAKALLDLMQQQAVKPETVTLPAHIKSIKIPTITMEQEFQTHYRRGFEAGKKSVTLHEGWIPIPVEAGRNQIDAIVKELRICRARLLKTAAKCVYDTVIASAPKLNEKG